MKNKETELTNKALLLISTQLQMLLASKAAECQDDEFINGVQICADMQENLSDATLTLYK